MQSWGQAPGYGCQFPKDENKETEVSVGFRFRGQTCKHDGSCCSIGSHDSAIKMQAFIAFAARKNSNKILFFTHLIVSLASPKILTLEKTQIKFCFLLT